MSGDTTPDRRLPLFAFDDADRPRIAAGHQFVSQSEFLGEGVDELPAGFAVQSIRRRRSGRPAGGSKSPHLRSAWPTRKSAAYRGRGRGRAIADRPTLPTVAAFARPRRTSPSSTRRGTRCVAGDVTDRQGAVEGQERAQGNRASGRAALGQPRWDRLYPLRRDRLAQRPRAVPSDAPAPSGRGARTMTWSTRSSSFAAAAQAGDVHVGIECREHVTGVLPTHGHQAEKRAALRRLIDQLFDVRQVFAISREIDAQVLRATRRPTDRGCADRAPLRTSPAGSSVASRKLPSSSSNSPRRASATASSGIGGDRRARSAATGRRAGRSVRSRRCFAKSRRRDGKSGCPARCRCAISSGPRSVRCRCRWRRLRPW